MLNRSNTTPVYIPPGITSLIQSLDVTFNKPFKSKVKKLANEHMQQNLEAYVRGDINASERCVLFTKWVGEHGKGSLQKRRSLFVPSRNVALLLPSMGQRILKSILKALMTRSLKTRRIKNPQMKIHSLTLRMKIRLVRLRMMIC